MQDQRTAPEAGSPVGLSANMRGIIAMVVSMAVFAVGDTIIKHVGRELPVGQMMLIRGAFGSLIFVPLAVRAVAAAGLDRAQLPMLGWRTACEAGCTVLFFSAIVRMPYADAAAILQFAPLAVTAGAAVFLGESVGWRRWLATGIGLLGVLIIIRPGTSAFEPAAVLVVGAVLMIAVRDLITRRIGTRLPAMLVAAAAISCVGLTGLLLAPFESWRVPSGGAIAWLALAAAASSLGFWLAAVALRAGEVSVVVPFRYSLTLFAVITSITVFGEWPTVGTVVGIVVVIGAGLYALWRERVRRRT